MPPKKQHALVPAGSADLETRAVAYVRMSTEHQQYSIFNQMTVIKEYAEAHSGEARAKGPVAWGEEHPQRSGYRLSDLAVSDLAGSVHVIHRTNSGRRHPNRSTSISDRSER